MTTAHRSLTPFGTTALVMGTIGFVVFLKMASLETFVVLHTSDGFVVVCLDAALPVCHRWAESVLTVFAAITVSASFLLNRAPLACRQTM